MQNHIENSMETQAKNAPNIAPVPATDQIQDQPQPVKRKRGRPRKNPLPENSVVSLPGVTDKAVKPAIQTESKLKPEPRAIKIPVQRAPDIEPHGFWHKIANEIYALLGLD